MIALKQSYIYKSLSTKSHIRLAEIQPATESSPLNITLREILLPSGSQQQCCDKYQTLSYEWGDGPRSTPLLCDGETLLITTNLLAALQRLRSPTESLKLWVDSICINQEDIEERSSQVALMPLIYKSGTRVFMWIGKETAKTAKALEMMDKLGVLLNLVKERHDAAHPGGDFVNLTLSSWNALTKLVGEDVPVDFNDKDSWDALNDLFSRTYFERTWIVQEVILSWNATVVCGTRQFSWLDLRNAVLCTMTCPCLPIVRQNQTLSYFQLMALAEFHVGLPAFKGGLRKGIRKLELITLLKYLRWSRCRDPRDQIYGVMGMAAYPYGAIGRSDPVDVKLSPPDYSKPVEEVYQETTVALIKEYRNLEILFHIGVPSMRTHSHMPSWVIDWSPSPERWWEEHNINVDNYSPHNSGTHSANMQNFAIPHAAKELFPGEIRFSDRLLITEGICLGTVDYISAPIHQDGIVTRVATVSRKLEDIYGNTFFTKYVNGQAITHAFVNTLLMNRDNRVATEYGMSNEGEGEGEGKGGWSLMYSSFLGALALEHLSERLKEEFHESCHQLIMTHAIKDLNAGLFLAAARSLNNNRFFTMENGLMGLGNFDLEQGDRVIMLKGARAPLVVRRRVKDGGNWMVVGDAYVHAATEVHPDVYTESLLNSWEEYRIN
jgi:hypothetical protein